MIYIIFVLGIIIDFITKMWAVSGLKGQENIEIIEGFFTLSYLENRGAAFGIFQGRVYLLAIVTVLVMGVLFYHYLREKNPSKLFIFSHGLILTGAFGNLIDRVSYGFVVDFISWHWKDVYYFPTFNMADVFVTIGTGLLIIYIFKEVD